MKNNYILGLNVYHGDSAACLMKNGEIIFAIEEERLNRIKHWAGFPNKSIKACLDYEKIRVEDINCVAINTNFYSNIFPKINYVLKNPHQIKLFFQKLLRKKKKINIKETFLEEFKSNKNINFFFYDHHYCHIASSHFPSNFQKALAISTDGFGDFVSTSAAVAEKSKIKFLNKVFFPHSLGIFYQSLTQFLGFKNYGDEYKMMGLSAYGKNSFEDKINKIIKIENNEFRLNLEYFVHHKELIDLNWNNKSPNIPNLFSNRLSELFSKINLGNNEINQEKADLAHGAQKKYEEVIKKYIAHYKEKTDTEYLSISGGCAMNSLANGKILNDLKFKKIYIPPAPGDSGGAIGAAIICYLENFAKKSYFEVKAYIGTCHTQIDIEKLIKNKISAQKNFTYQILDKDRIISNTVTALIQNKVIGWYQGRMEWGPRALGNRSIIANPACKEMKSIINKKIKRRESFRPFAPSVLLNKVAEWFDTDSESPFMSMVINIKKEKRHLIPSIVHEDGTGRLQTVTEKDNPFYYDLISSFESKTGIPMILNTSFNENEPVVNTHEEAIDCFLRTEMDVLVLDNFYIQRKNNLEIN